jgi:lysophospholipase L1-like esterase
MVPCDFGWRPTVQSFAPDVALLVLASPPRGDLEWNGQWIRPCTETYQQLMRKGLIQAIRVLGGRGSRVVVTTAAYPNDATDDVERRTDCDNRVRRAVAREKGAEVVDLFTYTCPDGRCRKEQDGVVLRPDGLHYRGAGARIVARWLVDEIGTAPARNTSA